MYGVLSFKIVLQLMMLQSKVNALDNDEFFTTS